MDIKEADYKKIEEIVRKAGKMMLKAVPDEKDIHEKDGAVNFCTDYDIKIQEFLIKNLAELIPEASYYGEEDTDGVSRKASDGYVFYLDPIDGTTNFMEGFKHSCVSAGLALDGKMIAGFIYNPYIDDMYVGIRGKGSFCNGRQLKIAERTLEEGLVGFDIIRYNEGDGELADKLFSAIRKFYSKAYAVREGGSAALGLCTVAAGATVAYVQYVLKPYDYAAAMVIVEEAGGIMTDMKGNPMPLEGTSSVICGNKKSWTEAKKILENI